VTERPTQRGARPGYAPDPSRSSGQPTQPTQQQPAQQRPRENDETAVRQAVTGVQDRVRQAGADARRKVSERNPEGRGSGRDRSRERPAESRRPAAGKVRRARLRLTRVDPWSVMKTAFLLSIALGVVTIVSVFMVWSVLSAAGVWESINSTVQDIVGGEDAASFDVENYLGTSRVLGFTMLVAVVDVVLLTAMATLGAFLYNMAAQLLGGIEVTLSEDS
jgi:hypothetical protein